MEALSVPHVTGSEIDWPSICWALLLACITCAALWVKKAYPRIAATSAVARVLAHVVIGYFGLGMLAFGVSSAVRSHLPVPGGLAWEGPVAVIGGLAACVIGGTTLLEHAWQAAAMRRATSVPADAVPVPVHAGHDAT